jgi:hypothetical protein
MPDDKKDNQEEKKPQAAPVPAPPGKPQEPVPQALRLKIVSNGDPGGTRLVDATTGQAVAFDCHGRCDLSWHPRAGGAARVVLVFDDVPVEAEGDVKTPFEFHGVVTGAKGGALPAGVTMTQPAFGGLTPQVAGTTPGPGVSGVQPGLHPTTAQAMAANERFNAEQGGRRR